MEGLGDGGWEGVSAPRSRKNEKLTSPSFHAHAQTQEILAGSNHPFIVTLYHSFQSDDYLYLCSSSHPRPPLPSSSH